jgi:hydrogenase expression/formation protein HypC
MCLAIPVKVERILDDDLAIVNIGGLKKQISIALIDDLNEGDYLILHVGYALSKIDPIEAEKTLALFNEMEDRTESTQLEQGK